VTGDEEKTSGMKEGEGISGDYEADQNELTRHI
jgi:hypothetical protein